MTVVKCMYVLEIPMFVLGLMEGSNVTIPTEFWRKSQQDGQSWRNSARLKIWLVRNFPSLDLST